MTTDADHETGKLNATDAPIESEKSGGRPVQTYSTRSLFGEAREICLEHDGARYLLKITRQGKLILNK